MANTVAETRSCNQFVSSLSQSIQSLCHGYLDFDSEIEIVGYINVRIDGFKKQDVILKENVNRLTDNSCTYTGESFLVEKAIHNESQITPSQQLNDALEKGVNVNENIQQCSPDHKRDENNIVSNYNAEHVNYSTEQMLGLQAVKSEPDEQNIHSHESVPNRNNFPVENAANKDAGDDLTAAESPEPPDVQANILKSLGDIHKTLSELKEEQAFKNLRIPMIGPIRPGGLSEDGRLADGTLPLTSRSQVMALEVQIREQSYHQKVLKHLVSFKSNPAWKKMVTGMLEEAVSNTLARNYNISGKGGKGKDRFQDLGLYRLIFAALLTQHQDIGESEFREVVKKWLQGAEDRDGGRSRRAEIARRKSQGLLIKKEEFLEPAYFL